MVAAGWPPPQPQPYSQSDAGADVVQDALAELASRCPHLAALRPYITTVQYEWSALPASAYQRASWGWPVELELALTLSNDAPVAVDLPGTGPIAGDTMLFDLGAGRKPGFVVNKPSSRYACGLPVTSTDDIHVADAWMAQLSTRAPADLGQLRR